VYVFSACQVLATSQLFTMARMITAVLVLALAGAAFGKYHLCLCRVGVAYCL
jgi:hypothetical protein